MLAISKNTVRLLRIPFSLFLAPVYLLTLSQVDQPDPAMALVTFLIIHLLVYPASNGYNSYVDKDEGSIGGLRRPPQPTTELFYVTLLLDVLAVILAGIMVGASFSLCILLYILASRAYSAPRIRLKKYPFTGFMVVVVFQGAFTCLMVMCGVLGTMPEFNATLCWLLLACSLQIGAAYPLTQIYQHTQDRASGIRTISMVLGKQGTFLFTFALFLLCNVCYYIYFVQKERPEQFLLLQAFFLPAMLYFLWWLLQVKKEPAAANFQNAMRMNFISSLCCGACFLLFLIIQ